MKTGVTEEKVNNQTGPNPPAPNQAITSATPTSSSVADSASTPSIPAKASSVDLEEEESKKKRSMLAEIAVYVAAKLTGTATKAEKENYEQAQKRYESAATIPGKSSQDGKTTEYELPGGAKLTMSKNENGKHEFKVEGTIDKPFDIVIKDKDGKPKEAVTIGTDGKVIEYKQWDSKGRESNEPNKSSSFNKEFLKEPTAQITGTKTAEWLANEIRNMEGKSKEEKEKVIKEISEAPVNILTSRVADHKSSGKTISLLEVAARAGQGEAGEALLNRDSVRYNQQDIREAIEATKVKDRVQGRETAISTERGGNGKMSLMEALQRKQSTAAIPNGNTTMSADKKAEILANKSTIGGPL